MKTFVIAAAITFAASTAVAQCFPRDALVQSLTDQHAEQVTGGGLRSASLLVELWTNPATGSFTIFTTAATGVSCVIVTGANWQNLQLTPEPDPQL